MKTFAAIAFAVTAVLTASSFAGEPPKPYPLQTCLVSGEKLGEMGKPVSEVYQGQEYTFCCKSCLKKFDADPAKYSQKLEAAKPKS